MAEHEAQWSAADKTWQQYRSDIEKWMEAGTASEIDVAAFDELTHEVIHSHNTWVEQLGSLLEAVHKH